jgi:hypothetical protein
MSMGKGRLDQTCNRIASSLDDTGTSIKILGQGYAALVTHWAPLFMETFSVSLKILLAFEPEFEETY